MENNSTDFKQTKDERDDIIEAIIVAHFKET